MSDVLLCVVRGIISVNKFEVRLYHPPTKKNIAKIVLCLFGECSSNREHSGIIQRSYIISFKECYLTLGEH